MPASYYGFVLLFLFSTACNPTYQLRELEYETFVDTSTKPVTLQKRKVYAIRDLGIYADNQFPGARLNGFDIGPTRFITARIEPENSPINPSPWYAFRIWAEYDQQIVLRLQYGESRHRYWPKLSYDAETWTRLEADRIELTPDSIHAFIRLDIGPDTLYVAGQELLTSSTAADWSTSLAEHPHVRYQQIGESKLGRPLHFLEIGSGDPKKKDAILLFGRQHPPELSGYLSMQAFVEALLEDSPLARDFRSRYRILLYPMLNPDGVDEGHWRHTAGGVDLNRDWQMYNQPESRQVAKHITESIRKERNTVILGIDFHSTSEDLYYTHDEDMPTTIKHFKDYWLSGIDQALPEYTPNDQPGPAHRASAQSWFFKQFGAEGITYEVGDETDRAFLKRKAQIAAHQMMQLLIFKSKE